MVLCNSSFNPWYCAPEANYITIVLGWPVVWVSVRCLAWQVELEVVYIPRI